MKRFLMDKAINAINWYQSKPQFPHDACLFVPTCSEYMKLAIIKYGMARGIIKGIGRIAKCHGNNGGEDWP